MSVKLLFVQIIEWRTWEALEAESECEVDEIFDEVDNLNFPFR